MGPDREALEHLLDGAHTGVLSTDLVGRITYLNQGMADLLGCDRDAALGTDVRAHLDADQERAVDLLTGRADSAMAQYEVRLSADGGSPRWALAGTQPIVRDGAVVGALTIAADVTERAQTRRQLAEIAAELEDRVAERTRLLELANDELNAFVYSVSHDLRAPLRSMQGFSRALVDDYGEQLDDRARDYLARIQRSALRMSDLIDGLLRLSHISRVDLSSAPIDVSDLAREIADELTSQEPERTVEVTVDDGMTSEGDPHLFRTALTNLLTNAFKFSRRRDVAHVHVGVEEVEGERAFFVRDDGAGFDPDYTHKLFGVFQRLHRERDFEGTGIGLATVQRIVARHGGRIWADGRTDEGATFHFTWGAPT